MARDWRKYDYNRLLFGARAHECRLSLSWTLGQLSRVSGINKGTLKQVEEGARSLPENERYRLIDQLTASLESVGVHINRREFLKLAGLTTTPLILHTSAPLMQPSGIHMQRIAEEVTHEAHAELLARQGVWEQASTFFLLAAR